MRILYIHQHFCTPAGAGGTRSYEFARRWVRQGHEVLVLCGSGYDETLPPRAEVDVEGIRVRALGVRYQSTMGFLARVWAFLAFALKSTLVAARARRFDVVLATSTPLTVALPAMAARWIAGRPVVFEVRDVWPDAAVDAGVLRNPLLISAARMLEAMAYRSAAHIVPLSTGMQDRIRRKGVPDARMTMIPNCSDTEMFRPDLDASAVRAEHGAEGKFIALYVGAVNLANDMEYLVEVARRLRDEPDIEMWFVGGGNRLGFLEKAVSEEKLTNVRCLGPQPKQRVPLYAAAADCGLVTFIPEPVYYENSPNKFFDYIASGLPVLFSRTTWLAPYLRRYEAGWVCRPRRPDEMADRIRRLRDEPFLRRRMGRNARRLAEEAFPRDLHAERYLPLLAGAAASAGQAAARGAGILESDPPVANARGAECRIAS